jgi:cytochrome b561
MNQQSPSHYDTLSRAFHWLTVIVVIIAFALGPEHFGQLVHRGIDPASRSDIVWHESLGMMVLVLTVLRLLWLIFRPAVPQISMSSWMRRMARLMHVALWTLLLALPISAFIALGSEGHALTLLGGVRIDQFPMIANSAVAKWLDWGDVHQFLGDAIMWLAGLHAVAAIYHHLVLKDAVLLAMLPHKGIR